MDEFRSLHLQKNIGEVLSASDNAPVVLVNRGQPRSVLMSAAEFRRLKLSAGEPIPPEVIQRHSVVVARRDDPLGYDISDPYASAEKMAEDALSGRTAPFVKVEVAAAMAILREKRIALENDAPEM